MARELHDSVATDLAGAISLFKVYVEGHPGSAKKGPADGTLLDVLEILERMLRTGARDARRPPPSTNRT